MNCPSCDRGELNARGVCQRCGVAVPVGARRVEPTAARAIRRKPRRKQDQDEARPLAEYVRKKLEDQG